MKHRKRAGFAGAGIVLVAAVVAMMIGVGVSVSSAHPQVEDVAVVQNGAPNAAKQTTPVSESAIDNAAPGTKRVTQDDAASLVTTTTHSQESVASHGGSPQTSFSAANEIILEIDSTDWTDALAGQSIAKYQIERRYHHPSETPTEFHLIATIPVASTGNITTYEDLGVGYNSDHSYRVTPILTDGSVSTDGQVSETYRSKQRGTIWGYGIPTGVFISVRPLNPTLVPYDTQKLVVKQYRRHTFPSDAPDRIVTVAQAARVSNVINTEGLVTFSITDLPAGDVTFHRAHEYFVEFHETGPDAAPGALPSSQRPGDGVQVEAGVDAPDKVDDVQTQFADDAVHIYWNSPLLQHRVHYTSHFEVFRRVATATNANPFESIGTTNRTAFHDRTANSGVAYDYLVRSVSPHKPPKSTLSAQHSYPDATCDTNFGNDLRVAEIQSDPNILGTRRNAAAAVHGLDFWLYGDLDGHKVRCVNITLGDYYVEREVYFKKVRDSSCNNPDVACEVIDVDPGEGVVDYPSPMLRSEHSVGPDGLYRYYMLPSTLFDTGGTYKYRWRVCTLTDRDLCSDWVDSGAVGVTIRQSP